MIENFVFAFENEGGRNWRTIKRASTKITECRPVGVQPIFFMFLSITVYNSPVRSGWIIQYMATIFCRLQPVPS